MLSRSQIISAIVAAIVGALLMGVWVIASDDSTRAGSDDAAALHAADMAAAAQDLTLAHLAAAVDGEAQDANVLAADALDRVSRWVDELPDRDSADPEYEAFATEVDATIAAAASGDRVAASALLADSVSRTANALSTRLLSLRDDYAAAVADGESGSGVFARLFAFVVLFILPVGAILIYRQYTKRRWDDALVRLDTRIEAEIEASEERERKYADFARSLRPPLVEIRDRASALRPTAIGADTQTVGDIEESASLLAGKVDDLFVAAGGETEAESTAGPVAMNALLETVVGDYAGRGYSIGGTRGPGTARGDEQKLEQILRNLVNNAVAYGGSTVWVYGDAAGRSYVVAVEDNGPGLPDSVAATLGNGAVDGDGLGLTAASKLAVSMGGSLEYERVAGRTSLILSVPLAGVEQ